MSTFWKGKTMLDSPDKEIQCDCECCHCKKIFMLLVLLLLSFIAGIMVGNCQTRYDTGMYYYTTLPVQQNTTQGRVRRFHRGAQPGNSGYNTGSNAQSVPNAQIGGFIVEVDQTN